LIFNVELKNQQGNTDVISVAKGSEIFGATLESVDSQIADNLGIEGGMQVKSVGKGSLATAGVKENYIILKINNVDVQSEDDLQRAVSEVINSKDKYNKVLFLTGVYPNGRIAYYNVDLSK
jgi:uncharacterized membrane protein